MRTLFCAIRNYLCGEEARRMDAEMEVEFDIKMTPGALYDYLLFHTYTSASGLLGAIVGALLVVAFFMGANVLCLIMGDRKSVV